MREEVARLILGMAMRIVLRLSLSPDTWRGRICTLKRYFEILLFDELRASTCVLSCYALLLLIPLHEEENHPTSVQTFVQTVFNICNLSDWLLVVLSHVLLTSCSIT